MIKDNKIDLFDIFTDCQHLLPNGYRLSKYVFNTKDIIEIGKEITLCHMNCSEKNGLFSKNDLKFETTHYDLKAVELTEDGYYIFEDLDTNKTALYPHNKEIIRIKASEINLFDLEANDNNVSDMYLFYDAVQIEKDLKDEYPNTDALWHFINEVILSEHMRIKLHMLKLERNAIYNEKMELIGQMEETKKSLSVERIIDYGTRTLENINKRTVIKIQ